MVKTLPSNAGDVGVIPGWGAKISPASRPKQKNMKQKQCCNKFNKGFKHGPYLKKKKKRLERKKAKHLGLLISSYITKQGSSPEEVFFII